MDLQFAEDVVDAQISQIENMNTKGVKALVIAAIDGSTLTDVVKKVKEQGAVIAAQGITRSRTGAAPACGQ